MNSGKTTFKKIITIDGATWISHARYNKDTSSFVLDLSKSNLLENDYVEKISNVPNNALFFQLEQVLKGLNPQETSLLHSLIYFDFEYVFQSVAKNTITIELAKQELKKIADFLVDEEICRTVAYPTGELVETERYDEDLEEIVSDLEYEISSYYLSDDEYENARAQYKAQKPDEWFLDYLLNGYITDFEKYYDIYPELRDFGFDISPESAYQEELATRSFIYADKLISQDEVNRNARVRNLASQLFNEINEKGCFSEPMVDGTPFQGRFIHSYDYFPPIEDEGLEKFVFFDEKIKYVEEKLRFIFDNGLRVIFENKKEVNFIPFDKSSSMGRQSKISFINEDLVDTLNDRLLLGTDFSDTKINLAKFYAYKGLYFSSGERVEARDFILNAQTVIVIDDTKLSSDKKVNTITAELPENTELRPDSSFVFKTNEENQSDFLENLFDGEGLICPTYSDILNRELDLDSEIASYQIRLPFTKGMLHRVDFHKFIKKFGNYQGTYMIKDAFGKERNLLDAKIILTKSMFKCFEWVKELLPENMISYFRSFHDNKHALYVCNTDKPYRGKSITRLTYQFLNTLCFSEKEYDELLPVTREYICKPANYLKQLSTIQTSEEKYNPDDVWRQALVKTDDEDVISLISSEPYVKSRLQSISDSIKTNLAKGKFISKGEVRYLSRDLMYFLYKLLNKADQNSFNDQYPTAFLAEDQFDMPGNNCGLINDNHYAIFRNPHLSRNEQCALRFAEFGENSLRREFFSHLKGVIMLSRESVDASTLGGADFDGDLVTVFNHDTIRNSVLRNRYDMKENDAYESGHTYNRSLPIINIKAHKLEIKDIYRPKLNFAILYNTFSDNIGKLSNLSAKYAKYAYNKDARDTLKDKYKKSYDDTIGELCSFYGLEKDEQDTCFDYLCPSLTILTGMDIDAPKNNVRPDFHGLYNALSIWDHDKNYIDSFKTKYEKYVNRLGYIDKKKIKTTKAGFFQLDNDSYHIKWSINKDNLTSIDLIPNYFFAIELDKNYSFKALKRGVKAKFIIDNNLPIRWKSLKKNGINKETEYDDIDNDLIQTAAAIMAYADILQVQHNASSRYRHYTKKQHIQAINTITDYQYPGEDKTRDIEDLLDCFSLLSLSKEELVQLETTIALSDWAFLTSRKEKEDFLRDTLLEYRKDYKEAIDELVSCDLLYNFSQRGYFILYLLIDLELQKVIEKKPKKIIKEAIHKIWEENNGFYHQLRSTSSYYIVFAKLYFILCRSVKEKENRDSLFDSHLHNMLSSQWVSLSGQWYNKSYIRLIVNGATSSYFNEVFWTSFNADEILDMISLTNERSSK